MGNNGQLNFITRGIIEKIAPLIEQLNALPAADKISAINDIRLMLHDVSPFRDEPVDCVLWVPGNTISGNDYNPNVVAPPEMELLKRSILEDGYTQPIVSWVNDDGNREVVDGFHRNRVGKEDAAVKERVKGYLPVTTVNQRRTGRGDRIASTIRHNRARGKHNVEGMSNIVIELSRRKWSDKRIARELGMEPDEVLRLKQISGLAEAFADQDFSEAWEVEYE